MSKLFQATLACALMPAWLLLAGCASPGGIPVRQASDQGAPPVEDPNSPQAIKTRLEASEKALSPAYLQRRRQAIAELLEKNAGFNNLFQAKLRNAQLAGPKVIIHREWANWLKPNDEVDAIYCARVDLDAPLQLYSRRSAVIIVKNAGNGAETLRAIVKTRGWLASDVEYSACYRMESYEPFPELEQARAQKRQALGKTD
jgi:hypothetical protein